MPSRAWTAAEVQELRSLRKKGLKTSEIAPMLGRTDMALRLKLRNLREVRTNSNLSPKVPTGPEPVIETEGAKAKPFENPPNDDPVEKFDTINTEIEDDRRQHREKLLEQDLKNAHAKYKALMREKACDDRLIELLERKFEPFAPSKEAFKPIIPLQHSKPGAPAFVGLISDTHVGHNVSKEETGGFGKYDTRQYCFRLHYMEQSILRLVGEKVDGQQADEVHLFLLGDIVHGMLDHQAEREATELAIDQYQIAMWSLYQFIGRIAAARPDLPIQIHTVVGNHGRWPNQKKMPTVGRYSNLDGFVYAGLQFMFMNSAEFPNVTVNFNRAPRQVVQIKGTTFLASHGDHLRGGDKQLAIPIHSIAREINATSQRNAAANKPPVKYFLCGDKHKHVSLPLADGNYIINGSFVGVDEFSQQFPPCEPVQLLFWVHPELRKTMEYQVKLQFAPELAAIPYEFPDGIKYLLEARQ